MFQVAGEEIKVGDLKVADLKARLAALGEPTSGKKAELVDRLTNAVAKSKKRSAPPPARPTSRHMVVASARAAELASSLPDDQVCDLPPPCDEAESKEAKEVLDLLNVEIAKLRGLLGEEVEGDEQGELLVDEAHAGGEKTEDSAPPRQLALTASSRNAEC